EYGGHGSGRGFQEEPQVLVSVSRGSNVVLSPGRTFTIVPMVNAGHFVFRAMKDGWWVVSIVRGWWAECERAMVVTVYGWDCGS
ncbi:type I methionyl aminopeptidase, partial [Escherichia coli]